MFSFRLWARSLTMLVACAILLCVVKPCRWVIEVRPEDVMTEESRRSPVHPIQVRSEARWTGYYWRPWQKSAMSSIMLLLLLQGLGTIRRPPRRSG